MSNEYRIVIYVVDDCSVHVF